MKTRCVLHAGCEWPCHSCEPCQPRLDSFLGKWTLSATVHSFSKVNALKLWTRKYGLLDNVSPNACS